MIKDGYKKITVIVPEKLKELIESEAKYEGRSKSNYICRLLMKHFNYDIKEDD